MDSKTKALSSFTGAVLKGGWWYSSPSVRRGARSPAPVLVPSRFGSEGIAENRPLRRGLRHLWQRPLITRVIWMHRVALVLRRRRWVDGRKGGSRKTLLPSTRAIHRPAHWTWWGVVAARSATHIP